MLISLRASSVGQHCIDNRKNEKIKLIPIDDFPNQMSCSFRQARRTTQCLIGQRHKFDFCKSIRIILMTRSSLCKYRLAPDSRFSRPDSPMNLC